MSCKYVLPSAIALTLAIAPNAFASQWVMIGENSYPYTQAFVDVDSIRGAGNSRTFWSKTDYAEDQRIRLGYLTYRSRKALMYVDCSSSRIGVFSTVLYDRNGNVVDSFDQSYLPVPQSLQAVVPDSVGAAMLNYICGRRTDVGSSSSTSYVSASNLNSDQAVLLINQWLQAKSEIFAPPFNFSKIDSLTTGHLYSDLTSNNGPVSWLRNNNAYYTFSTQRIDSVNSFSASTNTATIEVTVTESRTLYINGSVDSNSSGTDSSRIRYSLERSNGAWKISDFQVVH